MIRYKLLTGVEVASFGASFAPETIAMAVSTAVGVSANVANKAVVKHK